MVCSQERNEDLSSSDHRQESFILQLHAPAQTTVKLHAWTIAWAIIMGEDIYAWAVHVVNFCCQQFLLLLYC